MADEVTMSCHLHLLSCFLGHLLNIPTYKINVVVYYVSVK